MGDATSVAALACLTAVQKIFMKFWAVQPARGRPDFLMRLGVITRKPSYAYVMKTALLAGVLTAGMAGGPSGGHDPRRAGAIRGV